MVLFAAMAVHQSGDPPKALGILLANQEMFRDDVEAAYSFACFAAPAGEIDFAIKALLFNYRGSKKYWNKACLDADLESIWVMGAAGNISLDSSLAIANPVMLRAVEASMATPTAMDIDYVLKKQVPENCRAYLRIQPANGFYTLDRDTPANIRDRYLAWQQDYKARTLKLAQHAIQLAKEVVLDHQLEWAVEKAQAGNLIGARYHVLFALAHRPNELQRFAQKLRPLGLKYLFDELLYAESFDPDICVKLGQADAARNAGQYERALDVLDALPPHLQALPICTLPRANNQNSRGYRHFALRLYKQIARRWPRDPVGYYNAIENLMADEKWDEARHIFEQAPESYRILALSQEHQTRDERLRLISNFKEEAA
jgi:hypothetical protein